MNNLNKNRLHNLDYLRGIVAVGIMLFHYSWWAFGHEFSADKFMSRVGIYGVSIFYVLSGLTLFYVYNEKMKISITDIFIFVKKRFFRIYPLLWVVTFLAILISWKVPNLKNLFLNLTGLFGFVKWNVYFSTGVWSIGNELVFYFFFPIFLFLNKSYKYLFTVFGVLIFLIYLYFAFVVIESDLSLSDQWKNYTNPMNQLFLFYGGFIIGKLFNKYQITNYLSVILIIFSFFMFFFYPSEGDRVNLVFGLNRIIFTLCCFLLCIGIYKLNYIFPSFIDSPFAFLGEASYSIYLLHPIVYKLTDLVSNNMILMSSFFKFVISIFITLFLSFFSYNYFEKHFIRLGNKKLLNNR